MRRLPHWLAPSCAALIAAAPAAAASPGATIVSALAGPPKASFLARVQAGEIGGVILVGRWAPAELSATTTQLHAAGCAIGRPLLILVDQEGGFARRLTWAQPDHSAAELGHLGIGETDLEARRAATQLRNAGIDVDLAPVTDTLGPGGFLRGRSFGTDPALVGALAVTYVRALQAGRVAATAKHFPGLGAARENTDDSVVTVWKTALEPFIQAVRAGVKLVMVSSASYPRLDTTGTPAMFSKPIVTTLLRQRIGFKGVVVTDALDAPAAARTAHATARALAAGVDLLLYTGSGAAHSAYVELARDAQESPAVRADIARAVTRIRALERWLGRTC
ncbi:MAG TPA: glycoside hydrolase family 3 N-terminal domain-containing protein [Gaiellaceae bacterium]|nr:glycoside hydrolase family 3 N-terminal domain-containing protein [Gaiellaceae bacterium]